MLFSLMHLILSHAPYPFAHDCLLRVA
jgi:hypothetical protein